MKAKLFYVIGKKVLQWALYQVFDYIDRDDDGKLSKEEIRQVKYLIKPLWDKVKRK